MKINNKSYDLIFWIICIFILIIIAAIILSTLSTKVQKELDKCNELESCDKWRCLADLKTLYNAQRNLLLKEQNCLLKQIKK